jgi:hypothetical protein
MWPSACRPPSRLRRQDQGSTSTIIALVTGVNIPIPETMEQKAELKIMELEMVGEIDQSPGAVRASSAACRFTRRWAILFGSPVAKTWN